MKQELEIITPERAEMLLRNQANPRKLSKWHVDEFKRHIQHGSFETTHQGIALNNEGQMVDGQHRCAAIVECKKPVLMWVAYGIIPEAISVLDRGVRRTFSDLLGTHKYISQPATLAAIIAFGNSRPREVEVKQMVDVLGERFAWLLETRSGSKKGITAGCRLGAALAITPETKEDVLFQFDAYAGCNFNEMWPSVQALVKKTMTNGYSRVLDRNSVLLASFKAFSPKNKNLSLLRIMDVSEELKPIKEMLRAMIK
jgi:hypothetical protein